MKIILVLAVSYLFGSVPWALVIGNVFFHKDIRKEGSGNLGASNAGRVLGKPVAVIVTLLDAFKAFFSMMLAASVTPSIIPLAGLACCIGHCYPVFANFHGGKAVATSYGFLLGLVVFLHQPVFWQFVFPILCFFFILYLCRMVSVSSILSLLAAVIVCWFSNAPLQASLSLSALWCFVTYRHRSNIERIKNGTENTIKWMGAPRHGNH